MTKKAALKPAPLIAKNKKAFHDYEILEQLEAGIRLTGPEVKSCREHRVNLKGSYIHIFKEQAFTENVHISPYKFAAEEQNPTKRRKLLLHKKQIIQLASKQNEKGVAIVPLEFYFKGSLIKVKIGVCRGRKLFDKREVLKKRSQDLEVARAFSKKAKSR